MSKRLWRIVSTHLACPLSESPTLGSKASLHASREEAIGSMYECIRALYPRARDVTIQAEPIGDALILEAADLIRAEREGGA